MAHVYDTGLALPQRTLIVRGAVTLLAQLRRPPVGIGYLNAVISWGGVIRSYTDDIGIDLLWQDLQGRNPAIAIALGDKRSKPAGMGGFNFQGHLDLLVYHLSRHQRGLEAGRQEIDAAGLADDHADPGLHVQMEHTEELLIGQRCGASSTIKQIVPVSEEEIRTEGGLTLWVQHYAISVERTINRDRSVVQMLTDIRTNVRTSDPAQLPPAPPVTTIDNPTT